jgi:ABC-type transport system involved in cytochrome c biogenesis permease component
VIPATLAVGFATIALALASLVGMRESFDNDLDFVEE